MMYVCWTCNMQCEDSDRCYACRLCKSCCSCNPPTIRTITPKIFKIGLKQKDKKSSD